MSQSALAKQELLRNPLPARQVHCQVAGKTITIPEAHQRHSFGGTLPLEILSSNQNPEAKQLDMDLGRVDASQLALELESRDRPLYPQSAYVHYENKRTCDICGHKCLD